MAIVGTFSFGIMEVHLVLSLLLDSQVFQSAAFAHPEDFRSYYFRHSIRSFKSPNSNPLASDHASPSMPRRKIRCILAWNNRDYGRGYRCPRSLSLYGNTRLQRHLLTVDYQKDYHREQCVHRRTGDDNARNNDRKESHRRSSVGCHEERKTKSNSSRQSGPRNRSAQISIESQSLSYI